MATLDVYTQRPTRTIDLSVRRVQRRMLIGALVFTDLMALVSASAISYGLRFWLRFDVFELVTENPSYYVGLTQLLVPFWILSFFLFSLYDLRFLLGGTEEYARLLNACTFAIMTLIAVTFFGQITLARGWIVLFWLLSILCAGFGRFVVRRIAYALRRRGWLQTTTLIVGTDEEGRAIADQLRTAKTCGANIIGFISDELSCGQKIDGLPVLGPVSSVQEIISQRGVEEVLLSTSALTRSQVIDMYQLFGSNDTVELRASSGLYEILTTGVRIKEWGNVPLVSVNKLRLNGMETFLKTTLDYAVTLTGLLFVSPSLFLIAAAVKFSSPGPIFYRRRVLGRGGREFDALKFRTMFVNGNQILDHYPEYRRELEFTHKLKNDPRITLIGRFLRKFSLDELPQLFNVLLGQMSLVGPRMISPEEGAKYGKWKMNLLTVKPGITGLWQVSGRSDVSYPERVRLDMHYIRNYSIWLDLLILFRTIPAVFAARGAY